MRAECSFIASWCALLRGVHRQHAVASPLADTWAPSLTVCASATRSCSQRGNRAVHVQCATRSPEKSTAQTRGGNPRRARSVLSVHLL
eukprot:738817-Alexandrium_andersonii.AAC.1